MPASNTQYGDRTTGEDVVAGFSAQVKGKIVLITGANPGGIGISTAIALAKASPKLLVLAGRGQVRLEQTVKVINDVAPNVACRPLTLDLSSQESCRRAAEEVINDANIPRIDILINNAGVMDVPNRTLSPEGIELQFATNHVGHFLFTNLIFPKLLAAAKASLPGVTRVVNLSSRGVVYSPVRFSDYNFTKCEAELPESEHMSQQVRQLWNQLEDLPYIPQAAYGQSKTANVLFSLGSNERWFEKYGILSVAVHPGAVRTELPRHLDPAQLEDVLARFKKIMPSLHMKNLEEGCSTTLVAALDPNITTTDLFWEDCHVVVDWVPAYATDPAKADQLWELSEQLVTQKFAY